MENNPQTVSDIGTNTASASASEASAVSSSVATTSLPSVDDVSSALLLLSQQQYINPVVDDGQNDDTARADAYEKEEDTKNNTALATATVKENDNTFTQIEDHNNMSNRQKCDDGILTSSLSKERENQEEKDSMENSTPKKKDPMLKINTVENQNLLKKNGNNVELSNPTSTACTNNLPKSETIPAPMNESMEPKSSNATNNKRHDAVRIKNMMQNEINDNGCNNASEDTDNGNMNIDHQTKEQSETKNIEISQEGSMPSSTTQQEVNIKPQCNELIHESKSKTIQSNDPINENEIGHGRKSEINQLSSSSEKELLISRLQTESDVPRIALHDDNPPINNDDSNNNKNANGTSQCGCVSDTMTATKASTSIADSSGTSPTTSSSPITKENQSNKNDVHNNNDEQQCIEKQSTDHVMDDNDQSGRIHNMKDDDKESGYSSDLMHTSHKVEKQNVDEASTQINNSNKIVVSETENNGVKMKEDKICPPKQQEVNEIPSNEGSTSKISKLVGYKFEHDHNDNDQPECLEKSSSNHIMDNIDVSGECHHNKDYEECIEKSSSDHIIEGIDISGESHLRDENKENCVESDMIISSHKVEQVNADESSTEINDSTKAIVSRGDQSCSSKQMQEIAQISSCMESTSKISKINKHPGSSILSLNAIAHTNKIDELKKISASVQKLKIGLYLEAMKVHANTGAERKFSEYWDSFGKFISSAFKQNDISMPCSSLAIAGVSQNDVSTSSLQRRSNNSVALNGIEATLNNFLTTKSLRKKHNSLIMALMRQCMCEQVLESHVKQHIPDQWKKRILKVEKVQSDGSSSMKMNKNSWEQRYLDVKDIVEYHHSDDEHNNTSALVQIKSELVQQKPPEVKIKDASGGDERNDKQQSEQYISRRLPGLLEIDHIAQEHLDRTNITLTTSALQFVSIAVHEFVAEILNYSLSSAKSRQAAGETNCRKRKIKTYDVINSFNSPLNRNNTKIASRMIWERSISEVNAFNCFETDPQIEGLQEEITNLITTQLSKRPKTETNANRSQRRSSSLGKGKNLAAMVLRRQMDELSKKGLSTDDEESQQNSSMAENISRPPSTIGIVKSGFHERKHASSPESSIPSIPNGAP